LQDCKISSRAEIPKLDRVWQKLNQALPPSLQSTQPFPTKLANFQHSFYFKINIGHSLRTHNHPLRLIATVQLLEMET